MTEAPVTISGDDLLSEAQAKMHRGGFRRLTVVTNGSLIGIVTDRDVRLHAGHLERTRVNSAMTEKVRKTRIDFILEEEEHGIIEASRVVSREGGEILGIGTYREKLGENPVCYLRLLSGHAERIAEALRRSGFNVLGVHRLGGIDG